MLRESYHCPTAIIAIAFFLLSYAGVYALVELEDKLRKRCAD